MGSCRAERLLVLGIDTATSTAAVGVVRDETVLAEGTQGESRAHVASLPRLVERVLGDAGLTIADVEAVAVSIGPGSFTGLRIALGFAKGLVLAGGGLPLVGVPTLEALAWAADAAPGETVCAAIDARKREVYAALFEATETGPRRLTPDMALAPDALVARLARPCVLVGDAPEVYGDILGGDVLGGDALVGTVVVRPFATHHPRGGVVARLGARRLAAGERVDAGTLEPVYVRLPDAALPRGSSRPLR